VNIKVSILAIAKIVTFMILMNLEMNLDRRGGGY